jgi:hypothetical protein
MNSNTRITQNLVVNTGDHWGVLGGMGAIYEEASLAPNMVDHNVVWGCTFTNGIYAYSSSRFIVAHNLIANCAWAGIRLIDGPGRQLGDRTIPMGNNRIFNNILLDSGWDIDVFGRTNFSDYNALGKSRQNGAFHLLENSPQGITTSPLDKAEEFDLSGWRKAFGYDLHSSEVKIIAEFNPDTLELAWSVQGEIMEGPPVRNADRDFWGRVVTGQTVAPGPFGNIPRTPTRIVVDPRPQHH